MGYIFETEIGHIMNTVRARTIGESDTITLKEIASANIHPAIKAYFKADIERKLEEERKSEVRSKRFPYSINEVLSLQHQTDLLLMFYYQYDQQEFETLLDQAVHFSFNFLCRPQYTLVEFLFENQRRMSTSIIEKKLKYCTDYEYYTLLLKRYFTERGLAEVTYEEFKALLGTIDKEVVAQHSSRELAAMTRAMVNFVQAGLHDSMTNAGPPQLPINAAIVFFEDKGLSEIKLRLEYERDHNQLQDITIDTLASIIEEVRVLTSGEESPAHPQKDSEPPSAGEPPNEQPVPVPEQAQLPRQETSGSSRYESPFVTSNRQRGPAQSTSEETDRESRQESTPREPSSFPALETLFTPSEQRRFVKFLFHKDDFGFQDALSVLSRAKTWEEASLILDELFVAKEIDPLSKEAIRFTDKIYQRYNSKAG